MDAQSQNNHVIYVFLLTGKYNWAWSFSWVFIIVVATFRPVKVRCFVKWLRIVILGYHTLYRRAPERKVKRAADNTKHTQFSKADAEAPIYASPNMTIRAL